MNYKESWVKGNGHRIDARDYPGAGPAIVLMHGFPDDLHLYDRLLPHLTPPRRVVTFDFLGWGASDKPTRYPYTASNQSGDLDGVIASCTSSLSPAPPPTRPSSASTATCQPRSRPERRRSRGCGGLPRPVRVNFGAADPYLNRQVARRFHQLLPTSELFLLPDARHYVQLDQPQQVARLILAIPEG